MPIIEYEGQIHDFPDSFSDEDISAALSGGQPKPSSGNQFMEGLRAGGPGAIRSVGGTMEAFGKTVGRPDITVSGMAMQQQVPESHPPRVARLEDVGSAGDFVDWALYNLGSNLPQMGASVAGAVGGGVVGSALGPAGTLTGAAMGSRAGSFAVSEVLNAGDIYLELKDKGVDSPAAALLAGLPIAVLDVVNPVRIGNKVLFEPVKKGLVKRVLGAGAEGAVVEAGTEGVQEGLQAGFTTAMAGEDFDAGEFISRTLNAAAAGGLVGGAISSAVAAPSVGPLVNGGMDGQVDTGDVIGPVETPGIDTVVDLPPPEIANPSPPSVPEIEVETVGGGRVETRPTVEQPPDAPAIAPEEIAAIAPPEEPMTPLSFRPTIDKDRGDLGYEFTVPDHATPIQVLDDAGSLLAPAEIQGLTQNAGFAAALGNIASVFEKASKILTQRVPQQLIALGGKNSFGGITLDPTVHGFNLVRTATDGTKTGRVFINPFSAINLFDVNINVSPAQIASGIWHTIKHELLHANVKGHNEAFTSAATNVEMAFGAFNDTGRILLERAYADPNDSTKIREDIRTAMETIKQAQTRRKARASRGQANSTAGQPDVGAGQAGNDPGLSTGGTGLVRPDRLPAGRAESRGDYPEAGPDYTTARDTTWGASSNFIVPEPVAQLDRDLFEANEEDLYNEYKAWVQSNLDRKLADVLPGYTSDETKTLRDAVSEVDDLMPYERWARDIKGIPTVGNSVGPSVDGVLVEGNVERLLNKLEVPTESRRAITESIRKYGHFHRRWATLIQRVEHVKGFEPAERFLELVRGFWQSKTEITSKANDIIRLWDRLGKRGRQLSEFFFDVAEASMKLGRRLNPQELQALAVARKMDEHMMEVFNAVDRHFVETILRVQELLVQEVDRSLGLDTEAGQAKAKQIRREFAALRDKNYFPFSRFGKHVVRVKALTPVEVNGRNFKVNDSVTFEAFENKAEREERFKELKKTYGDEAKFGVTTDTLTAEMEMYQGFPPSMFETLAEGLNLNAQQRTAAKEMYISMLPQRSFVKHMKRKRGIAGFSRDAQRAYALYFQSASNHIAKLEYRWAMEQAVQDTAKFASGITQGNAAVYRDLYQNLAEQLKYILNPVNELEAVRGATFTWFFAFVPKQVLVNTTQLPLFLYPYLAAKSGLKPGVADMLVAKEIAGAMADVTRSFDLREAVRISGSRAEFDPSAKTLKPLEQQLMGMGVKAGFIGESFASEVAATASGGNLHRLSAHARGLDKFARRLTELGVLPFRLSEEYNRRVTFIAAIRMAQRRGVSDLQELFLAGRDAVDTTMFEYARWNRPQIMQGKKAFFFIFKSYMQHALHFAFAGPGRSRHWAMMMLFAGMSGLYGAEDLLEILGGLGSLLGRMVGSKDPLVDLKKELREIIAEIGINPDLFMSGLSSQSFGLHQIGAALGVPIPALDFQSSIGAGRVVPGVNPMSRTFLRGTESVESGVARAALELVGPPAAIGMGGMNFMKAAAHDSPAAWEYATRLLPRQWRNMSKAIEYTKGDALNSRGESLVTFDPMNNEHLGEILGQAIGLTPSRIVDKQEAFFAAREAAAFYQTWKEGLFKDYSLAIANKDPEAIRDVLDNVKKFNRSVPRGFALSAEQLRSSVQTRVKNQQLRSLGLPTQQRFRGIFEDYRKAYPALEAQK